MKHLEEELILRLAEHYVDGMLYDQEEIEAIQHIGQCDQCYDAFCCAAVLCEATTPEMIEEILPVVDDEQLARELDALEPVRAKVSIRVVMQAVGDRITVKMNQLEQALSQWMFEPPLSMAGVRGLGDNASVDSAACLEDAESRYTYITFDGETGRLYIQLDTDSIPEMPDSIVLRYASGDSQKLELKQNGRFLTGEATGICDTDFEILFL
jgi:hypothetical protein